MKFVFIINPFAGKEKAYEELLAQLEKNIIEDYLVYYTNYSGDGTRFVKEMCENNTNNESYCFVACGGDGTLNEVVNGVVGFDNCCFSVFPCGSGNDYVKYFGTIEQFKDLNNYQSGQIEEVDVMKVNDKYSVNVVNLGFECQVVKMTQKLKRYPIIGGKHAYTTGLVLSLFTGLVNKYEIEADGEVVNPEGKFLLCTLANGSYVGGAYKCAPRSVVDDGLMELCLARCMSLVRLVPLIDVYKKGEHVGNPRFEKYIVYRQVKKVTVKTDKPVIYCMDGELSESKEITIENYQKKLKFFVPKTAKN